MWEKSHILYVTPYVVYARKKTRELVKIQVLQEIQPRLLVIIYERFRDTMILPKLVTIYLSAWHNIPEDLRLHQHYCGKPKSPKELFI